MSRRGAAGIALAGLTIAGLLGAAAPAAAGTPAVGLSKGTVDPGQTITVFATGLPPLVAATIQTCGNGALDGSADCALASATGSSTDEQGSFTAPFVVQTPPVPCPCVVMVTAARLDPSPTVPIGIVGAPSAPLRHAQLPGVHAPLQIVSVGLAGHGPWTAWFGGEPKRTLLLTVRNPNPAPYVGAPIVLTQGRPGHALDVVSTQPLGTFGPKQTRSFSIPVAFAPFSLGTSEVHGVVGFAGLTSSFTDKTFFVPWGLAAIALVILQLCLLAVRDSTRLRLRRKEVAAAQAAAAASMPAAGLASGVLADWPSSTLVDHPS